MRALILSDIHGSAAAARKALAHFERLHCDKIFLLGDTLYHGPRNPLPEGHGPMGVVEALRPYGNKIVAVRGNCDADVDLMMLDFVKIEDEYAVVEDQVTDAAGKQKTIRLFLSHGHIFMPECFPANALDQLEPAAPSNSADQAQGRTIDAYLYGHTHIYQLQKNFKGVLMVNPGSTSLPKGGNPATFGLYDSALANENGPKFSIHELETGKLLQQV
ncbi:MAG: phosphodiesterase [Fibrobacter sp.]|nr:phosphodiesterase [Fibrobacter sp.]